MSVTIAGKAISGRIAALRAADVLFSDAEESFNIIARFAAEACGVPVGLVNFVGDERQWTKAACGIAGVPDLPVDVAFCSHTIEGDGILEIPNTLYDDRFVKNPLVVGAPFIRFYAGATLLTKNGLPLGSLCVIDYVPHRLTEQQRKDLVTLAALLSELIAMRVVCEHGLRSKLRALGDAFEQTDAPLLIVEQKSPSEPRLCTYVNPSFEREFRMPAGRIVGRNAIELMAGAKTDRSLGKLFGTPENLAVPVRVETIVYDGEGVEHVVEIHRRPVPSADGTLTSWVVSLRDLTEQRAAAAELALQAERMHALYSISSKRGMTGYDHVDSVLRVGVSSLALDYGFVARVDGDYATLLNMVGERPGRKVGDVVPLGATWLAEALEANDVRTFDDPWLNPPPMQSGRDTAWGSYIVAPISIGEELFGAIGFLGPEGRKKTFSQGDREFVRLIGSYVGACVERKLQKEKLDALAFRDALTGLCNRAMLFQQLEAAISGDRRDDRQVALHYIDLDGFKSVNDTAGHAAGDAVLVAFAKRLLANVREGDIVARIGGDEFVVVQTNVESPNDTRALAERLIRAMSEPLVTSHGTFRVGASIGIAVHSAGVGNVHDLLSGADRALYHAKASGKGNARMAKSSASDGDLRSKVVA